MEQKSNKSLIITLVIVGAIAALGIGFFAMNNDDSTDNASDNTAQMTEETQQQEEQLSSIVGTAQATESLSTLVSAVVAADLVDTLNGEGPYTVLAPTNDAFANLPAGTLDSLLLPENKDQLAGILTYHVISGDVMSSDLTNGQVVETVNGQSLTVNITEEGVFFVDANGGRAKVSTADVETSNGTVHIIDAVLLPSA
jgi:uncharacterized surface protein with fasciclin (FAS1) repeats